MNFKSVVFAALLLFTSLECFGQGLPQRVTNQTKRPARGAIINVRKPAVFLTFLRSERVEPRNGLIDSNPTYLFFKLSNNTRWPIWLDMSGTPNEDARYGDVSLYYEISDRKTDEKLSGRLFCHVCSFNSVGPGKSVTFAIPRHDALADARMRIRYEFGWEQKSDVESNLHLVEFYFRELPESILVPAMQSGN